MDTSGTKLDPDVPSKLALTRSRRAIRLGSLGALGTLVQEFLGDLQVLLVSECGQERCDIVLILLVWTPHLMQ